jgi:glycerol-3-phosphate O-acyltransferase/dihydroxyacetone phosphate acyltransferase
MAAFPVSAFTTLDSQEGFNEASKKIRAAMRERGEMRRRKSQVERGMFIDRDTDDDDEEEDGVEIAKNR